jgi:hypothetical protein
MVKGEPSRKHAREEDDAVPMVKEDNAMLVVKEDDIVLVVNQDEALVDPLGDRDNWTVGIMNKAFMKIRHVL